ncbi:peptidase M56 BlaR1 [Brevibacillus composti]|uniref:Peptidase M56 BlaR1 n=1 Tax=Brevibacillus composti TaxID=2796470 RepID=A0A7T5EJH3_9BACL|nr:peptidase M56 BlaR1 [Brevibacillus composti]QQE73750.1 peptidase M56 BlaR1 [Brevibacillus composti]QUO40833.1 peptidase M56 BlaR1 [Brevibacillus composti]
MMRIRNSALKLIVVGSVLGIGITLGILSVGTTLANRQDQDQINFPVNENGQTYGSSLYASSPSKEPDLIKAIGVDGTVGYVKSTDLNESLPKTPTQALDHQRNKKKGHRTIPLYDVNGKKVIGTFHVENGEESFKETTTDNE